MNISTTSRVAFVMLLFSVAEFLKIQAELNTKLINLIENLNKVNRFETIFLLKSSKESYFNDKFIRSITSSLQIPVILTTGVSSFYLKERFNENLLTIVETESSQLFLQRLLEDLQHLRHCKTIFVLKNSSKKDEELKNVFNFCWQNRMVNVIAVFENFGQSSTYYSYNNFGNFKIEEIIWNKNDLQVFPNRMKDLQGITLPILFGGPEPAVIVSKSANGNTIIGGYVGHIFNTLAKKHNARLNTSNVNTSLSSYNIHQRILDGTFEISGATKKLENIEWFSYPFTITNWGVMVPVEHKIPINKVFAFVFHWKVFALTIVVFILLSISLEAATNWNLFTWKLFFNMDCFRGILGQSFPKVPKTSCSTKIIYSLIFLLGIIMVTSYDAFLQSFMTHPPRKKVIKSFDDLKSSDLKIYIMKSDLDDYLNQLKPKFVEKHSKLFLSESDFVTFGRFRDTLNTKYAFTVPELKWRIYENQQKFFNRQIFRWSEELCLVENIFSASSINENSIYKKILNFHILETQSSGLLDFWMKKAFYELLGVGKIRKLKFGFDRKLQPLKVEDLKWIWIFMGLGLMAGILCFIGEVFVFKFNSRSIIV
ncbi:uncharacterized protein LOC129919922 [Episyrphus balteatus]|uniref:uncharacterized protein LOC129919922 n=1 Tax=Episyrphus balteatus TaxID=286459 RepID=UPI002484F88D|nr:uncharacterized protein LOC129919922 [Episyrphus balteatus]